MPKPRHKKTTEFQNNLTKSAFMYGYPNRDKFLAIGQTQNIYTEAVNTYIKLIAEEKSLLMSVLNNQRKNSDLRLFEKNNRLSNLKSAYSQNAFDEAVSKLSVRLNNIKREMQIITDDVFSSSKYLFVEAIKKSPKSSMIKGLKEIIENSKSIETIDYYNELIDKLKSMSNKDFKHRLKEFKIEYEAVSIQYKLPFVKNTQIPIDSRLGRIEISKTAKTEYVVSFSILNTERKRIEVPVITSRRATQRLKQHKQAGTFFISVADNKLKVSVPFEKRLLQPKTTEICGVDVGIKDCLYTSNGKSFGSMDEAISFYKNEVEPSFANISNLRNKKRKISYYLKKHPNLPDNVRRSLIEKNNLLETMIRKAKRPYQKNRHYKQILNKVVKNSVEDYIKSIDKNTLTSVELLDIKDFDKGHLLNGKLSLYARGLLSNTLVNKLNWCGYDYVYVMPDYTSKICPECNCLESMNRSKINSKEFKCLCCGYQEDADYVGAINIKRRAVDSEVIELTERYKYKHKDFQLKLKALFDERNEAYVAKYYTETTATP